MALGYLEAKKSGPLPKTPMGAAQNPENVFPVDLPDTPQNKLISYTIPLMRGVEVGPVDPLEGPTSPEDMAGLVQTSDRILGTLQKILIATRAIHPTTSVIVEGPANLLANQGDLYKFTMGGRPVPALNVFLQNNTPQIVYVGFDDSAGLLGVQVPANGGVITVPDIAVGFIGIWVTAATFINGASNRGQPMTTLANPQLNFMILAWGNSEWNNVWGQTS